MTGFQTQGWKKKQQQATRAAAQQVGNQLPNKGSAYNKPKFQGKPNAKNFRQKNPNCSNENSGNYPKSKFKKNMTTTGGNDFIVNLAEALKQVAKRGHHLAESNDYSTDEENEEEQISEGDEEAPTPPRRLQKRFAYESEITGVGGQKVNTSMGGLLVGKMESVTNKSYAFATLATIIQDKNAACYSSRERSKRNSRYHHCKQGFHTILVLP
ncbi:hypothetical protein GUITHDRAFT_115974 [Guillardia theta CCMP2712]|uniref:Uncharacterized protein n=1 Tax=Guillardia theta (strain CCMP2712) TaxID=905079 RepID=L1IPN9_GUITC|nr:hypothetical protein GUITHDRAFT_115974 [Guillardia theta CCMP2712]EKX37834.1 hypothetical protein GUITHDRAFT_115974 [Guillardia theta CCMP2712]|eukprot:XP_005824814.1 hypothetical protein GUITHDRAFT_115974 [Guillardia theta CCMP2712]